jgi:hypothetical protein
MTGSPVSFRIDPRILALLALLAWGAALVLFGLIRFEPYGIDEGATRALLLNWSVAGQVAHPIVVFGMPDFRALFFIPLGLYWPGSVIAAKMFTALVSFGAIWLLYLWSKRTQSDESALIGSGLMLVAPITIMQVNALGTGPYLLLLLTLTALVDQKCRAAERAITGWYFVQMLLVATVVTLHPAGLAIPAALAWHWKQQPINAARRNPMWIGFGVTVVVILAMQAGWVALPWLANPLDAMATAILGLDPLSATPRDWGGGVIPLALVFATLWFDRRFLTTDLVGMMLALATLLGLLAADAGWALIAVAMLAYRGTPLLVRLNGLLRGQSFVAQRGLVLFALFVVATLFMQVDKAQAHAASLGILSPEDELIRALGAEATATGETFRAASQWPGRTSFATRHAALPLPPPAEDGEKFLQQVRGLTHIVFAHNDPRNAALARNIAQIGGNAETVALQPGGVIIKLRTTANESASLTAEPATR